MPNEKFCYSNYLRYYRSKCCCIPKSAPRSSIYQGKESDGFFYLENVEDRENINIERFRGWKIHISIDDSTRGKTNLSNAWDIVKDILIERKIQKCKVVIPDVPDGGFATNHELRQYGKQITIYCNADPKAYDLQFWQETLQEIETAFCARNIYPDPTTTHHNESQIQGSQYFTYRNDAQISTGYEGYAYALAYLIRLSQEDRSQYSIFNNLDISNISLYDLPMPHPESMQIIKIQLSLPDDVDTPPKLFEFLSTLPKNDKRTQELITICDIPYSCYGGREYTDSNNLFENPFSEISVNTSELTPRKPTCFDRIFRNYPVSETVTDSPIHKNLR